GECEERRLEGRGDREHHRLRRQRARMADDHDAREDERRIDVARQLERGVETCGGEDDRHREDRAAETIDERGEAHFAGAMSAPSGRPWCPCTMTISPALAPPVISASFGGVRPLVALPLG